jgi:hypothetical protein
VKRKDGYLTVASRAGAESHPRIRAAPAAFWRDERQMIETAARLATRQP